VTPCCRCVSALLTLLCASSATAHMHRATNRFGQGTLSKNAMIDKLISMLGEEKDKIAADLVAEEKEMKEYFQFCKDEQGEKAYSIKTANRKIEDLSALIDNNNAEIESLEAELTELGAEQNARAEQKEKAEKLRKEQHTDFLKREDEQAILVSELEAMLKELKHQMATMTTPPPVFMQEDAPANGPIKSAEEVSELADDIDGEGDGGFSFAQLKSAQATEHLSTGQMQTAIQKIQRVLNAMSVDPDLNHDGRGRKLSMLQESDSLDPGAKAQSVEVVSGLVEKAEKGLQAEREAETNQAQAHSLAMQALKDETMLADDKIADDKKDKNKLSEEAAKAEAERAAASEAKAADEKFLARLKAECKGTADAWATRQSEAKDEMEAINQAKEILASRVKVFNQQSVSFFQTSLVSSQKDLSAQDKLEQAKVRQTLMNHFRKLGNKLHSVSMLNLISVANAAPMDKVKNLIKGLIEKLEKEAAEAADTHAFCEEEKKKNADATDKTQATLDKLGARLDKAQAKTDELNERVAVLSDEMAEIDKGVAEATKIRQEEKATFQKANADFKEAADAVGDAIDVLKDFYGSGNAFIQLSAVTAHKNKDDPWKRMFGTSLRAAEDQPEEIVGVDPAEAGDGIGAVAIPKMGGASAAKGGIIIGMMETMAGEFSKTVAELQAEEDKAQKEYDELMQDNKVSKTSKDMEITGSKSELAMLDVRIGESTEDKKLATKEMAALKAYILKLKPTCEGRVVSFAERQAKREAEIAGCKEALQILDDTTDQISLVQRAVRHNLRKH